MSEEVSEESSEEDTYTPSERRPIASRRLPWIQTFAGFLARRRVSANAISASSLVFASIGAFAIVLTAYSQGLATRGLWLAAAVCVQLRLLANLFDGMVALASGQASPVGELFNEVPDRLADAAFLVALGLAPGSSFTWATWRRSWPSSRPISGPWAPPPEPARCSLE